MKYLIILLISFTMTQFSNAQSNVANSKNDEAAVNELAIAFADGWNKHDAKLFAAIFSEDADLTNVRGQRFVGRHEIETHHKPAFETRFKNSTLKIVDSKVRFIKTDVAAVDVSWEMASVNTPDGKEAPNEKGLMNFIAIKNNNKWLIAVLHNMALHN